MKEHTSTPEEFACRLDVDRKTIYNICNELRLQGIDIDYSRQRQTFYYKYPHLVEIKIIICQYDEYI